jgi:hypothetical protein
MNEVRSSGRQPLWYRTPVAYRSAFHINAKPKCAGFRTVTQRG